MRILNYLLLPCLLLSCGERITQESPPVQNPPPLIGTVDPSCFPLDRFFGMKEFDPAYGLVPLGPEHTHFSHGSLSQGLIDDFVNLMWPPFEYGDGSGGSSVGANHDVARAAFVTSDYKLVVAGRAFDGTYNLFGLARYHPDGALDTTFSGDGVTTTQYWTESWQWAHDVTEDSTGKIIAVGRFYHGPSRWGENRVGQSYNFMVARYNTDGSLDATFGDAGVVIQDISTTGLDSTAEFARGVVTQTDDKVVVAGYSGKPGTYDHAVMRFNTDGTLDPTFSGDGIVVTDVSPVNQNDMALAVDIEVATGRKIVVTGCSFDGADCDISIVRYASDGTLDPQWGTGGITRTDIAGANDRAFAINVINRNEALVAGRTFAGGNWDLLTARYLSDGTLDATYGSGGTRTDDIGGVQEGGHGILRGGSQNIYIAGRSSNGTTDQFLMVKYLTDGARDTTFNTNGFRTTTLNTSGWAIGIAHKDDHLFAIGRTYTDPHDEFGILRYNSDGSLAASGDIDGFYGGGLIETDFNGDTEEAYGITISSNNKIYIGGYRENGDTGTRDFAVARYFTSGALDTTYGTDGRMTVDFDADADEIYGIALTTDEKLVAVGYRSTNFSDDQNRNMAIARFTTARALDVTFNGTGTRNFDFSADNDTANSVVIQGDDKIIFGGFHNTANNNTSREYTILRLNTDGTNDNTWDGDGVAITDFNGNYDEINHIVLTDDNKVYAAGVARNGNNATRNFAIARYDTDGSLDATWATAGLLDSPFSGDRDEIEQIILQTDGKVVAVGLNAATFSNTATRNFAIARFTTAGVLDATFGTAGRLEHDFSGARDEAWCVGIMYDGRLLVGGRADDTDSGVVRLLTDGAFDTTFNTSGIRTYDGGGTDRINNCFIASDSRAYFTGLSDGNFMLMRIWP